MRAVVCTAYGPPDVLRVVELEKPSPADDEVLVRVIASTVTAGDYRIRGLNVPTGFRLFVRFAVGFRRPRGSGVLGTELAGVVEAVGPGVTRFRPGDEVFAYPGSRMGGNAEYVCLPADGAIAPKPENLTHAEAAALPFGAITALHFLRDLAGVRPGENVLVYGASGNVGTAAVQVAKHLGARVTGVCSTRNVERVRSLGADRVVDYTRDPLPPDDTYDVVMEVVGKTPYDLWKPALVPDGRFVMVTAALPDYLRMLRVNATGGRKIVTGMAEGSRDDLLLIRDLAEAGALRPVIDRSYPLEQTADAHAYAERGHKTGSVVIQVEPVRERGTVPA